MDDKSSHPHHSVSVQGSNILRTIPNLIPEVGWSSMPVPELAYEQLGETQPINCHLAKSIRL